MFGDAYLIGYSESFYCDIYIRCYITYLLNMGFLKFQKTKLSIFHIQPKSQHKSIIITYMTSFITSYLKKCFWTMMLEKTLKSPLDWKETKPVNPKGNQSWIFTGKNDAEAETPIFWPFDVTSWLIGKVPDAGKNRRQEKGIIEDEMVKRHPQHNVHEFEQALANGERQGSLVCYSLSLSPLFHHLSQRVEHDWMTEQ